MQIKSEQFITNLENTLKHYLDPLWLGDFSALASPYILGHRLPATATSPQERGRVLQQVLQEATGQLNGKYAERHQALLQKYYFEALPLKKVYDLFGLTLTCCILRCNWNSRLNRPVYSNARPPWSVALICSKNSKALP